MIPLFFLVAIATADNPTTTDGPLTGSTTTTPSADDPCYPGSTITSKACMDQYDAATNTTASQLSGAVFPRPKLHKFEIGTTATIVYYTGHGMKATSGLETTEEIWFTRIEENMPKMRDAIKDMQFDKKSHDEVRAMLDNRVSAVVGMQPQGINAKVNIGTIKVQQIDPDGTEATGGFFRPCWMSAAIDTDHCEPYQPEGGVKYTHDTAAASYKIGTPNEFPFTGNGYTFDWMSWEKSGRNLEHAVGLNEFVIPPQRGSVVKWDYEFEPIQYFCTICANGSECGNFDLWMEEVGNCPNLRGSKNVENDGIMFI